MFKINKFASKPIFVDAVEVTADNLEDIAKWCQGEVRTAEKAEGGKSGNYVKVRVHHPRTDRQTKAFVGDHVLYSGHGFKVYTPRAFEKSFEQIEEPPAQVYLTKPQADKLGIKPGVEARFRRVEPGMI